MIIEEKDLKPNELPVNRIVHGDALSVLKKFPSESVDCVITSPPYWGKRYYPETEKIWGGDPNCDHEWVEFNYKFHNAGGGQDYGAKAKEVFPTFRDKGCTMMICEKCGAHLCQLGLEPTPELYVEHLIEIFREVKRVLKPHGNVFVVIDDTFSQRGKGIGSIDPKYPNGGNTANTVLPVRFESFSVPQKSLCLVPELFTIKMVYEEGWILRNKIIWCKKVHIYKDKTTIGNGMPESVKDRLAHTHEVVYHFVKNPKYWYDLDAVRIPHKYPDLPQNDNRPFRGYLGQQQRERGGQQHPLGANPGDVIQINTEPLKDSHYAPFPTKLVEFLIKVGCPSQICKECGKPRERIVEIMRCGKPNEKKYANYFGKPTLKMEHLYYTVGWTDCGCGAGFEPGIVLDPFLGSGTTSLVALQMGRRFVGVELNKEYCKMAYKRIKPYLTQQRLEVVV